MEKGALFFDIDGTILSNHTHEVPESTYRALKEAKENGYAVFVNTGRTFCSISSNVMKIDFSGVVCGCGTHIIYEGKDLFHSSLDEKKGSHFIDKMQEYQVEGFAEASDDLYFPENVSRFAEIEMIRKWYADDLGIGEKASIETKKFQYDKLYVCVDEKSNTDEFLKAIQPELLPLDRLNGTYECIQREYSKATGIEYIRKYLGLDMDQIYVFGDSSNDLAMFKYATHTIAMKEHDPVLDPHIEYVTDTVDNDGIYKAMKHYGII